MAKDCEDCLEVRDDAGFAHGVYCRSCAEGLKADADRWNWFVAHPHLAVEMLKLFTGKKSAKARFSGWVDAQIAKSEGK